MEMIILVVLMVAMFWFMTRSAKKQRENMATKQKEAAVPGTWVITIGGFLGKVVSVDGDVITLESPSGVETIWSMQAIREAYEPNFGAVAEADEDVSGTDSIHDTTYIADPRADENGTGSSLPRDDDQGFPQR